MCHELDAKTVAYPRRIVAVLVVVVVIRPLEVPTFRDPGSAGLAGHSLRQVWACRFLPVDPLRRRKRECTTVEAQASSAALATVWHPRSLENVKTCEFRYCVVTDLLADRR